MDMTSIDRRKLLALGAASAALPSAIQKAWAIDAKAPTGTIRDVEHVVVLMQENRSFDHYFGTMSGVRGFGDRFPVPLAGGRTVWAQAYSKGEPREIAPFPLNTQQTFAHMRVEGTPHSWFDAQYAWDNGRMASWPDHKQPHAMGHYEQADIPFQWALAEAFTICDAYHCSFMGGTNTNRLFLWSGTNDGQGAHGGPSISNSHDTMPEKGGAKQPYLWTTYCERLEAAGVSWKIYENMADNFGDNPLVGFKAFRDSVAGVTGSNPALAAKGLSTQHLDVLKADVVAGKLPAVSWIISAKDLSIPACRAPHRVRTTSLACSMPSRPIPMCGRARCSSSTSTKMTASSITCLRRRRPVSLATSRMALPRWIRRASIIWCAPRARRRQSAMT